MTTSSPTPPPPSLWRNRAWQLGFPAATMSRLGDVIFELTLVVWIASDIGAGQSWAPAAVSGVLLCTAIPTLIAGPIAGVMVDRHDRRAILLWSTVIQAVGIGSMIPLVSLARDLDPVITIAWIFAALIITNAAAQFFLQARTLMVASTIPAEIQNSAFSAQQAAYNIVSVVGPPLAAPLLFSLGAGWAIAFNAATFVIAAALLLPVRWESQPSRTPGSSTFWADLREGFSTVRSHVTIRAIVVAMTIVAVGSAIMNALIVFFIEDSLAQPATFLGILSMAYAGGSLLGAAIAPKLAAGRSAPRLFVFLLLSGSLGLIVFPLVHHAWASTVLFFALAIPYGVISVIITPVVIGAVPRELLGRTVSVLNFAPSAASMVGAMAAGLLASATVADHLTFSIGPLVVGKFASLMVASGFIMLLGVLVPMRALLRADPDPAAPAPAVRQAA